MMEISNYSGTQILYGYVDYDPKNGDVWIYIKTRNPDVNTPIYDAQGLPSIYHFTAIGTTYFSFSDGTNEHNVPTTPQTTITVPVYDGTPFIVQWMRWTGNTKISGGGANSSMGALNFPLTFQSQLLNYSVQSNNGILGGEMNSGSDNFPDNNMSSMTIEFKNTWQNTTNYVKHISLIVMGY